MADQDTLRGVTRDVREVAYDLGRAGLDDLVETVAASCARLDLLADTLERLLDRDERGEAEIQAEFFDRALGERGE